MAIEIEAKILNIDKDKLEKKLAEIGATKIEDVSFRSISFDFIGYPMDKEASWIRLRDDGKKVTLAYKKRLGTTAVHGKDSGMEEIEVVVSNYEDTAEILKKIGMIEKFSQEKKRTTWKKDAITFDIDTWPKLNPYLEIEAGSWEEVDKATIELGYKLEDKLICSATQIFAMNGINDKDYSKMTFSEWIKR
jgi:adenylate cyclase class 2